MKKICAWCNVVIQEIIPGECIVEELSHGICEECLKTQEEAFDELMGKTTNSDYEFDIGGEG